MEIKTKFDIGQTVYRLSKKGVKDTEIYRITVTQSGVVYNDSIIESELFATEAEAQEYRKQENIQQLMLQRDRLNQQIEDLKNESTN